MASYSVSRGHPAPLVGKRFLAGGLRVHFCLESCLVYINFAHTHLALCGRLVLVCYPKKWKTKTLVECVQL